MAVLEFEITHVDGSTETLLGSRVEEMSEFEEVDIASLYVDRPQINDVSLHEDRDEITVYEDGQRTFRGVLRDTLRGGAEVELVCDSLERYALDAEPSDGGLVYDPASDTTIVQDAISDCPNLTAGTIEEVDPSVTMVFSHASPAKRIRRTAEATGAEVRYNPDGTIDYVASLGRDRSESATGIVLSPDAQNISGGFEPERDGGDRRVTHLKMLGAGEGSSQIGAIIVPEEDPYDYEGDDSYTNVRRYTAPHWTDGERKAWDTRINKDITDATTLADHGERLIDEFSAQYIEITTTVEDHEVRLGDVWTLRHPEEQIDLDLRAVEVERIVDANGTRFETTFSNRRLTRQRPADQQQKDVDRYNMAFEGTNVTMNTAGGRQPVSANFNYQFSIYYPEEITYEHRVKLQVVGLPYRAYSQGAASSGGSHSHSVDIPSHSHDFSVSSHTHDVDIPSHSHDFSYGVPYHLHPLTYDNTVTGITDGHNHSYDKATGTDGPTDTTTDSSTSDSGGGTVVTSDSGGFESSTTDSGGSTTETSSSETPEHTHDPQPGIIETFGTTTYYPSNCDVIVNGTAIGVSLGDGTGEFTETVDLAGELTPGTFNRIEVSSDTLGHITAALDVDVYRQILGRG